MYITARNNRTVEDLDGAIGQPAAASSHPKVLLLTSWYPDATLPLNGIFVRDQAEVLATRFQVLVHVVRIVARRRMPRDLFAFRRPILCGDGPLKVSRGSLHEIPDGEKRVFGAAAYFLCEREIKAILRRWGRPDVIHAHVALPAGWIAVRLGDRLGVPAVVTEHTGPLSAMLPNEGARLAAHDAFKRAAKVLAVSPTLASAIEAEFPDIHPTVLGNLVRTDVFRPGGTRPPGPFCFGALALMRPGKGLDVLLHAARRLLDAGVRDFRLAIGGDGPERAMHERLADSLGLRGYVDFLGLLSRAQVRDLFQKIDAFVLPSLGETFGLAPAEALACGKPVIATRCGGPEFVLAETDSILVPPGDAEALAAAMRQAREGCLRAEPDRLRESIERRFGPAAFIREVTEIYRSVGVRC